MYLSQTSFRRDGFVWRWATSTATSQRLHLPVPDKLPCSWSVSGPPHRDHQHSLHLPVPDKLLYSFPFLDYTHRDQTQPSPTCPRQASVELICLEMGNTHREQPKPPRPGLQLFRHGPLPDSCGKIPQLIYFSHWKNYNDRVRTTTNYQK
jgi:hypothetical protein